MRNVFVEGELGEGAMRADSVCVCVCVCQVPASGQLPPPVRVSGVGEMEAKPAAPPPPTTPSAECDGCVCGSRPAASFHRHARRRHRLSANACWFGGFFGLFFWGGGFAHS